MSKPKLIRKNLALSQKFTTFLLDNPKFIVDLPNTAKYIMLSADDKELNAENQKLANSIMNQGGKVVIVKEKKKHGSNISFEFAV